MSGPDTLTFEAGYRRRVLLISCYMCLAFIVFAPTKIPCNRVRDVDLAKAQTLGYD